MDCTICGRPVTLAPSASERARKFGGKPSNYAALFTAHASCIVEKRSAESRDAVRRYPVLNKIKE